MTAQWVKLPSGSYVNMAQVAEVRASETNGLVLFFVGSGATTFLSAADAVWLRNWLDSRAE